MKRWIVLLLIAVLVFVGLSAFGSVNQYEMETGLTVDALMLPMEKTVNVVMETSSVNGTYAELAVMNYEQITEVANDSYPAYLLGIVSAASEKVEIYGGVADRLIFPLG